MAYLNPALTTLRNQFRAMFDGISIGWIADAAHSSTSQHQPDRDGSVDAIDPMIGPTFTHEDAQELWETFIANRDQRIWCIIWNHHIVSGHPVTQRGRQYDAWESRPYIGTDDPHTNHMHIETNQARENDSREWDLSMPLNSEDLKKIADIVDSKLEARLALSKLGGRTVGGSINNLIEWGLADHPVDNPETSKVK